MTRITLVALAALLLGGFSMSPTALAQVNTARNAGKFVLSGYVRDGKSGESLPGASLYFPSRSGGTTTNAYGFYSITLPADTYSVEVSYIGYTRLSLTVDLRTGDQTLSPRLKPSESLLKEVVVEGDLVQQKETERTEMSIINIPIQQVREIPALLGEKDVLKVIQLLPGVQKGREGNAGIYVRGGGPDQNLIILDEANVYNAFHLFGFFSLFNGDALKSVDLIKGGFPARYGGRLSSVIELNMKDGNKEEVKGEMGIGLISSRATVEGPIAKGRSSFLVSGRRTYFDALVRPFLPRGQDGGYYFYDLNAKLNYDIDARNRIFLSGYFGKDNFFLRFNDFGETFRAGVDWGNATGTLRWNHMFNNRLFANTSLIFTDYTFRNYITFSDNSDFFSLIYRSGIRDFSLKHDIDYRPSENHSIRTGFQSILHRFNPSALAFESSFENIDSTNDNVIWAWEHAVYAEDDIKLNTKWNVQPGVRLTAFSVAGTTYKNIEPRLSSNYRFRKNWSAKFGYALMNQYVHLISNTGAGLPTDLWVPATPNLKPQRSEQFAAGLAYDFPKKPVSLTFELYHKDMDNIISYREGASFLNLEPGAADADKFRWEDAVTSGRGNSKGMEAMIQKKSGRWTGWMGYTLSWTRLQFDELNSGQPFWARYDRRHDFSIVSNYTAREMRPNKDGVKVSATWVYGTGNAITLPVGEFSAPINQPGGGPRDDSWDWFTYSYVNQYPGRNQFRMAPYHRLDFGLQFIKQKKGYVRTLELSVYNVYNRLNPYFYYIGSADGGFFGGGDRRVLRQVALFPRIPSISYNISF
jgi:hypothetical protein